MKKETNKEKTAVEAPAPTTTATEPAPALAAPAPAVSAPTHITVVIPYCKEFAQGKELLFALRSWQKNVRFGINVVVIGDREDWFDDENITFIVHECVSANPQIDTLAKLQIAVESDAVTAQFIWSNDDIYLVNPVSLAHIELPKVLGVLAPEKYSGVYRENIERTATLLKDSQLPTLNYGTHTPMLFDKGRIRAMIERFPMLQDGGYLFSSVYYNSQPFPAQPVSLDWRVDQFLLPVKSYAPDENIFAELIQQKVFLNNAVSGYSPWLESFLEGMFPEKSDFEV